LISACDDVVTETDHRLHGGAGAPEAELLWSTGDPLAAHTTSGKVTCARLAEGPFDAAGRSKGVNSQLKVSNRI
jgi:hypothetical protein